MSVELGNEIDTAINARVLALDAALRARPFEGFLESLPSYRALLVRFEAGTPRRAVRDAILAAIGRPAPPAAAPRRHRVRVVYDGPDLAEVARRTGLRPEQVVEIHAGSEYTALMLGFRPGFGYLGLTDPRLAVPRLATPRPRVEAGAVALAGRQTAVYPGVSPGGWNLIGRSDARLFDPFADEPARLRPGDLVRFEPVGVLPDPPRRERSHPGPAEPALEVEEPGLLTTVQDLGRSGLLRFGVGRGGATDPAAAAAANAAVGNPDGAALLESTGSGLALRFLTATRFCVAGADLGAVLERGDMAQPWPVPLGQAALARPGNRLRLTGRRSGFRGYLALAGGIDVPPVLGSRATDLGGGFGGLEGRPLAPGDRLGLGSTTGTPQPRALPPPEASATLRVIPGPQADHFDADALETLYGARYTVAADADRTGCRLDGPRVEARPPEIVTDGLLPGAIQVPPDGRPIVTLADAPTSGGYPKPAVVVADDLPRLAQLEPGTGCVRLRPVELPGD